MKKLNFIASLALLISVATVQPAAPTMSSLIESMYTGAVKAICNNPWTSATIGVGVGSIGLCTYAIYNSYNNQFIIRFADGSFCKSKHYWTEKNMNAAIKKLLDNGYCISKVDTKTKKEAFACPQQNGTFTWTAKLFTQKEAELYAAFNHTLNKTLT